MTDSTKPTASVLALYGRIFVHAGARFGASMGLILGLVMGATSGWEKGLVWGLLGGAAAGALFGLAMSAILGTLAIRSTRTLGLHALNVRQVRVRELHGSQAEVLSRATEALEALPRCGATTTDANAGSVEALIGCSWRSFGEVVTVRVEPAGPLTQRVWIESRPKLRATLVDYGANTLNVNAVEAKLAQST